MMKGRMKYVPSRMLEEIENIKIECGLDCDSDAFKKIVDYSHVGREVERINPFEFVKKRFVRKD